MKWVIALALRATVLGVVWVSFAGWDVSYLGYGVVSVAAATALSLILLPPSQPDIRRWPRRAWHSVVLAGWFLGKSVSGGVDVAGRALKPTPDIAPAVITVPFDVPAGPARQLVLLLMNLMPGTMVQQVVDDSGQAADHPGAPATAVQLHTLSRSLAPEKQWRQLQRKVAAAYGVTY